MATPYAANVSTSTLPNNASAVSWSAVLAGAAAAAALSLILLILGVGLGLSSVSPWVQRGVSATSFGISTIVWLTCTQLIASGMGGYLAGRLRTRWAGVHTDEVYFRDTAHGFLAWAVASLATAAMLASAIASIVGGGVSATASVAGGAMQTAMTAAVGGAAASSNAPGDGSPSDTLSGALEGLFRKNPATVPAGTATASPNVTGPGTIVSALPEVSRIFMRSLGAGGLPPADVTYIGQLVAQRTELSQQDAEKRVTDTYATAQARLQQAQTAAKEAADKARKASATAALWLFVTLLIGAFSASFAAIYGGRRRDM
jgi:hypothetical protein